MGKITVEKERVINASPETIFSVLSNYKEQRPRMLTPNFIDYRVEKGGKGSGTVISYLLRAANRERAYRMSVDEAVKGRVLTERDNNSSLVTTWVLSPVSGDKTRVSVASEWEGGKGVGGFFERTFAPLGLRRIYGSMLTSLIDILSVSDEDVTAVQGKEYRPTENLRGLIFILSLVVGFALGLNYIQKANREKEQR
ncbi:SRPBCC family protein [Dictyobacter halimunensis]